MKRKIIGLLITPSPKLLIAIIGILKSGACLLPLAEVMSLERLKFITADAKIDLLITDHDHYYIAEQLLSPEHIINLDEQEYTIDSFEPKALQINPKDDCYIIYTSGSTGLPKGVAIRHESLSVMLLWAKDFLQLYSKIKVLQNLSYIFDFGLFELLTTVLSGGELHFFSSKNFTAISNYINTTDINLIHTTPSFMTYLLSSAIKMKKLSQVHLGGEEVTNSLVQKIISYSDPGVRIYNGYGPTECTINSTIYQYDKNAGEKGSSRIPIGKPSANNLLYILNESGQLQPAGVIGEICIGGIGLAESYLNSADLTALSFVPNTFIKGEKMYRTGDLGRWLADGNIEFFGRKDDLVKINGHRIEPGEIEKAILKLNLSDVITVTTWCNPEGEQSLVAYLVHEGPLNVPEIRMNLGKTLPAYMVPNYYIAIDHLPLTSSGKVNKRELPLPAEIYTASLTDSVPPRNETEEKLARIWQEVLGKDQIGVKDDFFELGGHSLKAIKIITRIQSEFNVAVDLKSLFTNSTIEYLAEKIANDQWLKISEAIDTKTHGTIEI